MPIGTIGDFAIFSFQAIKHMTTVDGGLLTMRDASRMAEARRLRWFGLTKGVPRTDVDITTAGFKYNMHNVAATIGTQQLVGIDALIARHVENGRFFNAALANAPGVTPAAIPVDAAPSYWLYTLLADDSHEIERRMVAIGVGAAKLQRPNHLHTVFAPYRRPLPGLDAFYRRLLHLPCGWWVDDEVRERMLRVIGV